MVITGRPCHCCIIITFTTLLFLCLVASSSGASDKELLLKVKGNLQNTGALSSWSKSTSPCSGNKPNWRGVLCQRGGKISGLSLVKMGLKGTIDVDSLKGLPYLRTLNLMNNEFDGALPKIGKLVGLRGVYLSKNKFSGEIPGHAFEGMQWLKKIVLSNNQLTGAIPASLGNLPKLMEVRLDGNKFSGPIPPFQKANLRSFNVSNNQLDGPIPPSLTKWSPDSFAGNKELCGAPLGTCDSKPNSPPPPPPDSNSPNSSGSNPSDSNSSKKPSTVSVIVVAVVVGLAVIVIGAVILILHRRRRENRPENSSVENPDSSSIHNQIKKGKANDSGDESRRSTRSQSSNHSRRGDHMKLSFIRNDRERFDLQELLRASAEILGSGCFSSSYKASLPSGTQIVVKRFKQMNNVGKEEFHEHMRRIGRLDHPNLHPLVAYYHRKEEKLLVTDFVKNGSLAVRLHGNQALGEPGLDWPIRLKIVKGIAKGLEYLYKDMPSLIAPHGNLKSSNVLLTESFEPLLCDYGLVPLINQDLAQDIMVIYKSPEYLHHGRITKKSDVWCLGILILEILTGKFPANFLQQGKGSEVSLANWVHSVVPEEWTSEVFDKEMGKTNNSDGEMVKLLKIALGCCDGDVENRWDLKEAVEKIQEVKERDQDDDFYTSSASEADVRSPRGLPGDEINF